jgi:cytoskeletal protein CcmA (bactofilin family)
VFGLGISKRAPIDKIETVIGPNTNFKGTLISDGSVRIDGICEEGLIKTVGNVVIGPEAKVAADIEAENVSVSGTVTGKITAPGRLEILSTGKVWGAVSVGSFYLDEDGFFNGNLAMSAAEADESTPPPVVETEPAADEPPVHPPADTVVSDDSAPDTASPPEASPEDTASP